MSLVKTMVRDQAMPRPAALGDLLGAAEFIFTLATVGAGALTGTLLTSNILSRTGPTAAFIDTVDIAANILAALSNGGSGDSWRLKYINNTAFAGTVTGVTGVTVTNGIVNASSVKEFLIQLINATPASSQVASITTASAIVTGMTQAQTNAVSVGQLVTGTGIPAGTTVIGVTSGVGVTLSANATTTNAATVLAFNPVVAITGLGQGLL